MSKLWASSMLLTVFLLLISTVPSQSFIASRNSDVSHAETFSVMKKSIRRWSGSSSRNCFFSPINCVIAHDASTYRKMAGF